MGWLLVGAPRSVALPLAGIDLLLGPVWVSSAPVPLDGNGFASQSLPLPAGFTWSGQVALQTVWMHIYGPCGWRLAASNALR